MTIDHVCDHTPHNEPQYLRTLIKWGNFMGSTTLSPSQSTCVESITAYIFAVCPQSMFDRHVAMTMSCFPDLTALAGDGDSDNGQRHSTTVLLLPPLPHRGACIACCPTCMWVQRLALAAAGSAVMAPLSIPAPDKV